MKHIFIFYKLHKISFPYLGILSFLKRLRVTFVLTKTIESQRNNVCNTDEKLFYCECGWFGRTTQIACLCLFTYLKLNFHINLTWTKSPI